jgi:hypothetical protein
MASLRMTLLDLLNKSEQGAGLIRLAQRRRTKTSLRTWF